MKLLLKHKQNGNLLRNLNSLQKAECISASTSPTAEDGLNALNIEALETVRTSAESQSVANAAFEKLQSQLVASDTDFIARTARESAYQTYQDAQNQLARLTAEAGAVILVGRAGNRGWYSHFR